MYAIGRQTEPDTLVIEVCIASRLHLHMQPVNQQATGFNGSRRQTICKRFCIFQRSKITFREKTDRGMFILFLF